MTVASSLSSRASSSRTNTLAVTKILPILLLITAVKFLLIPSYFSTDFDVHRNWLAITRHLPLSSWYFEDLQGRTVHTLDYPPGFAWFEYFLSNNFVTTSLVGSGWLDDKCLDLLPDDDNVPSERCVTFQRCTVILSDVILFFGAYFVARSTNLNVPKGVDVEEASALTFLLIATNPGLIVLDHIHFQYNGMLLGLLLCSVACIIRGAPKDTTAVQVKNSNERRAASNQMWELSGAALFALLLAMKHLYVTLAPLFFVHLLRHHCFVAKKGREEESSSAVLHFSFTRFVLLAAVTLVCLLGPFLPFFVQQNAWGQIEQILKRLFPFGRGLVHDYWAANVWALYLFAGRVSSYIIRMPFVPERLAPALICAWKAAGAELGCQLKGSLKVNPWAGSFFMYAVVFSSFSAFMLGYHVHEKAIMTAIIPLTSLATTSRENARLFIRTSMFGLFGLFPLLFRPDELLMKSFLYLTWMLFAIYRLESLLFKDSRILFCKESTSYQSHF
ncbi:hypothetical protein HJC23_001058 [Cyclotella cryptica]|uniref:Alpha-1,3-glucosyltransferase n=1 Tax=Cyclotella cryptica TaxID=29204 RepID=A0ABD3QJ69_9STRA